MNYGDEFLYENEHEATNGAPWSFSKCWDCAIQQYGLPLLQYCIHIFYAVYTYCTPINMALFLVKSVPTVVYVFNIVRNVYVTSRERMKLKQIELEDLQLQIQIINTKLSVRDVEFTERAVELRRGTERLRKVRARVREVIAADKEFNRSLHTNFPWEDDSDTHINSPPEESDFILQLLKTLKYDEVEAETPPEMRAGEATPACPPEDSVYSSTSDAKLKQNCRVKIIKVTNVYKVAYLKHFIKQKRLRRATKHAILKKKMNNVKKLLDDWQKTLNMVINSKLSIFNMDSQYVERTSQEAMGDFKQDLAELSDSDSDLRNPSEKFYEQPFLRWAENTQGNFKGSFEEAPESEFCNPAYHKNDYSCFSRSECSPRTLTVLSTLPEETHSQVVIEETQSETNDEHDDNISI